MARNATVAHREWTTAEPASRPTGDAAWAEIADLAALSQGLAAITPDLTTALKDADLPDLARQYDKAVRSGLNWAARATTELASRGPLQRGADLAHPPQRRVLVLHDLHQVPDALTQLEHLLGAAQEITPGRVQLVARTLATTTEHAARSLASTGEQHHGLVKALRGQGDQLTQIVTAPRRVAALAPGEVLTLGQSQEIHRILTANPAPHHLLPEALAVEVARGSAAATRALDRAVNRMVRQGRWISPDDSSNQPELQWTPVHNLDPLPTLVRHSNAAALRASLTRVLLPQPASAWPTPRDILADTLDRLAGRARPTTPGTPLYPLPPKGSRAHR